MIKIRKFKNLILLDITRKVSQIGIVIADEMTFSYCSEVIPLNIRQSVSGRTMDYTFKCHSIKKHISDIIVSGYTSI